MRIFHAPAHRSVPTLGPFTGRQLTTIVVAAVAGVVLLPGAVWAVDSFSNVAIQDPVSGAKASVDAGHHVLVGDGSGPLTVDGGVVAHPAAPSAPWHAVVLTSPARGPQAFTAPSAAAINLTSLSVESLTSAADIVITAYSVPGSATTCSQNGLGFNLYALPNISTSAPFSVSFPTPLQFRPAAGYKACLYAMTDGSGAPEVDASGFFGS